MDGLVKQTALDLLQGRLLTRHEIEQLMAQHQVEVKIEVLIQMLEARECVKEEPGGYKCQRCNNQNLDGFTRLHMSKENLPGATRAYCLNCLQMGRMIQGDYLYASPPVTSTQPIEEAVLTWQGILSAEQKRAAEDLVESLAAPAYPHAIIAVTGAGKTEMIFPVIAQVLQEGGRVAVASPRIDVCLELFPRLQEAFASTALMLLYGDVEEPYRNTSLVICTTHQLLRFEAAFDLLIVDEVDAFPYAGDASLHFAVKRAVKPQRGKLVYLTATPDAAMLLAVKRGELTQTVLPARYHGYPLPEPQFKWVGNWSQSIDRCQMRSKIWRLLRNFLALEGVKLIFMPQIKLAEALFDWLSETLPEFKVASVHSKDPERKAKVQALRDGDYEALISTTILERGVTFTNCHVCIVGAENGLYSTSALVQMSGRVGRKSDYPTGHLIYAHAGVSRSMLQARKQIEHMNQDARAKGLVN